MNPFKSLDTPLVYKLPVAEKSMFSLPVAPVFSINPDYPDFRLGFQHYIHANKDKYEILKQFDGKKKVYLVVNRLNNKIDDYDNDLDHQVKKISGDTESPEFYKIWEILGRFTLYNSGGRVVYRGEDKSVVSAVKNFAKQMGVKYELATGKADLMIISYEGGKFDYRNLIEQDSFAHVMREIATALSLLVKKGSMILKIDEMFTLTMNKVLYGLTELFDKVYIFKPISSPQDNSERYIVCESFNDNGDNAIKALKDGSKIPDGRYIVDIFPKFSLPKNFLAAIRKCNTDFANRQLMDVNRVIDFINGENYYGETYQNFRDQQVESTKKWSDNFFNIKKNKNDLEKSTEEFVRIYEERSKALDDKLTII